MPYQKSGSPFLYDDATGALVGLRDADGSDRLFPAVAGFGVGNVTLNNANRLNYRKAFAKVLSGSRARILLYGDSTTVGAGAGTDTSGTAGVVGARPKNYPTRLAEALTALGIPAYNEAIIGNQRVDSSSETYAAYDSRLTLTGGFADTALPVPGGRPWLSTTSGAKWAFTPSMTFDRFDVYTVTSSGNGSLDVDVDGGATITTISTNAAQSLQKTTVTCSRGTHTINLTTTSTSATYVLGVVPWDSTLGGLDIIQAGWYGGTMSSIAATTSPWSPSHATALSALAPDLAIVQMTINDNTAATAVASYAASLATVDAALSTAGAEVLLMSGIPSNNANASNGTLDGLVAAVAARAASRGKVFADFRSRSGSYANLNAVSWMYDTVHGNAKLYADEGYWMAEVLRALAR